MSWTASEKDHRREMLMRIIVGEGSCGIATGAKKTAAEFEKQIMAQSLPATVGITGCVGNCYLEPIVDIYEDDGRMTRYTKVQPENVEAIVEGHIKGGKPVGEMVITPEDEQVITGQHRVVLRNTGLINPEVIEDYIAKDGYKALEKVVKEMTPEEVIEEIKISGLRGRGGAGFPTWFKWNAAKQNKSENKYMVCNADEGDPGAFMDRSVLEGDPHSLIEGMIIGGFAMEATEGVVYCRAEYPLAIKRLQNAIDQAKEKGYLGKNILGSGYGFDIRIKAGAGAFVCGEETALIASLEGERGMPRLKPPFPAQKGYWQQPTNINNVETFANVPWILLNGGKAFGDMGTEKSKGTKVFALAGKIKKGGLVEVPMGLPLKDVIYGIGGGIKEDKEFKAVQMGGPSGGCIPAELVETPVDYENINKTGAIVGSGGMIVMDETTCMVDMARYFLDFTKKESCGKCNYCRIGTKRMLEILERITEGEGKDGDIELLEELATKIKDGSMCGLGQTAPNPVLTTIKYFRNEYEDHIYNKKCTAKSCKALITFEIHDNCVGCTLCARKCPVDAITGEAKKQHVIDQDLCIKCGRCLESCKFNAITVE
jgi:NADH-quinone oxidoreductase subunit F